MRDFFPPRRGATPTIYAFAVKHPDHAGVMMELDGRTIYAFLAYIRERSQP